MAELTYDTANVYYVDPADALTVAESSTGEKVYITPEQEDLCIAVDLEVDCPKRFHSAAAGNQSKFVLRWETQDTNTEGETAVNFMGGTKFSNDNTSLRYLTTEGLEYVYGSRTTPEMFGIKSIYIDYSTFFIPNITIEFADVRGASLFSVEESAHENCIDGIPHSVNYGDVARSFFECFFRFPYPTFRLKVKGLYGEPISYELTVAKCNHVFDASTGNYNVTANMVGYTYSFMNDVTMNMLMAAPDAPVWGSGYWESNFAHKDLPDGSGKFCKFKEIADRLRNLPSKISEQKRKQEEETSQYDDALNDLIEARKAAVKNVNELIPEYVRILGDGNTKFKGATVYNDPKAYLTVILCPVSGTTEDILADIRYKNNGWSTIESSDDGSNKIYEIRGCSDIIKSSIQSYSSNNELPALSVVLDGELTLSEPSSTSCPCYIINGTELKFQFDDDLKRVQGVLSKSSTITSLLGKTISNGSTGGLEVSIEGYKPYWIYTIDYSKLINRLSTVISTIQTSRDANSEANDLSALYNDALGFKPSIENVTAIIMAHLETLLACVKSCENDVFYKTDDGKRKPSSLLGTSNITSVTRSENDSVPPFPDVYAIDKGKKIRAWLGMPGIVDEYAPEVTLINSLVSGIETTGNSIEETKNRFETEMNDTSGVSGSNSLSNVVVPIPIVVNDFISSRAEGSDLDDNSYSPFGKSISHIFRKNSVDKELKALLKLLKIRWSNVGKCSDCGDNKSLGKLDAENFMALHAGEIDNLDLFLNILDAYNSDMLSSVNAEQTSYKTADRKHYLVPNVGYDESKVERDAKVVTGDELKGDKAIKYNLYNKNTKHPKYAFYKYSDYAECIRSVANTCSRLDINNKPAFLCEPSIEFKNEHTLKDRLGEPGSNKIYKPFGDLVSTTQSGFATAESAKVYVYKREGDIELDAKYGEGDVTISLQDIDRKNITQFVVFGTISYYATTNLDEKAGMFLEWNSGTFKGYNEIGESCESVTLMTYGDLLLYGCRKLLSKDTDKTKYKFVIDEYIRWRNEVFSEIDKKYSLKKGNNALAEDKIKDLIKKVHELGVRRNVDSDTVFMQGDDVTKDTFYRILDVNNKNDADEINKYIDVASFKKVYESKITVFDGSVTETTLSRLTDWFGWDTAKREEANLTYVRLYNKDTSELRDICSELLTPVVLFEQLQICTDKGDINKVELPSTYASGFIDECKAYIKRNKEEHEKATRDANIASLNQDVNGDLINDVRLGMYIYLKTLYDKWLCGNYDVASYGYDFHKRYGYDNLFGGHFYFIDSFYNKIGDELVIDVEHLVDEMYNSQVNQAMSLMEFMTSVASKNSVQTLCVQNFLDFSRDDDVFNVLERAFKPIAYNESSIHSINSIPDFVFIYTNQPSQHVDIGDDGYGYEDDGFHLNCGDALHDVCVASKRQCKIPAFGVKYGSMYQHYFKDIQVGMDASMATEQSTVALFAIANASNGSDGNVLKNPVGQDLFTVYSNNSYTCKFNMMGSAWIQPLMYFDLQNVPLFHGAYMIKKVTHRITPGTMVTEVTGVRQANVANKLVDRYLLARRGTYAEANKEYQAAIASVANDCQYVFFDPTAQDVANPDVEHSTNLETLKHITTEHEGETYSYYDIVLNEVLGFANDCGRLNDSDAELELTIKLLTSVLYCRIKWYNYTNGGWNKLLQNDTFSHKFIRFDKTSIDEDRYNNCVKWIEEILEGNPSTLKGRQTSVEYGDSARLNRGVNTEVLGKSTAIEDSWLGELCNYRKSTTSKTQYYEYFQHKNIVFCSGYGAYTTYNPSVIYEVGDDDSTIKLSQTSITNRVGEETRMNDITVGVLRSIKSTCEKTVSLDYSKFSFDIQDSDDSIRIESADKEQLYNMFDMLLNTYYDYIYELYIDIDTNKFIVVRVNDQTKGLVKKRSVGAVYSSMNPIPWPGKGENTTIYDSFKKSIYKKYLNNATGDNAFSKLNNSALKLDTINFLTTNITEDEVNNYFSGIVIEKCGDLDAKEYNVQSNTEPGGIYVVQSASDIEVKPLQRNLSKRTKDIEYIVIHYTAGASSANAAYDVWRTFNNGKASADYVVDDQRMLQLNPNPEQYYCHATETKGMRLKGKANNRNSISIEMCSNCRDPKAQGKTNVANHDDWYFTQATLDNAVRLTQILMKRYNIDSDHVIRHYDVCGKVCPGVKGWNTCELYSNIAPYGPTGIMNNESEWNSFKSKIIA